MGYRKFQADLLFDGSNLLDETHVLVTDEEGRIESITTEETGGEDIQRVSGLLTPGFINTHCHLELSHLKDIIPKGTGLVDFLLTVMKSRAFPQERITAAMENAVKEIYETGTIAVGDICNTTDSLAIKKNSNIRWHNFIEVMGFTDLPQTRFDFASKTLRTFRMENTGARSENAAILHNTLSPHAPYSVSDKLFSLINDSLPEIITIHNQETAAENELYQYKSGPLLRLYDALQIDPGFFHASGKTSLQTYLPLIDHPSHIILVHNTYLSSQDIEFVEFHRSNNQQRLFFSTCIKANQYIECALPPLMLLRDHKMTICLGTDSLASNDTLNIVEEMKTIQMHFPSIPLEEILTWATINGAMALKIDDVTGSFTKGKTPGVVHISELVNRTLTSKSVSKIIL